MVKPYIEKKTKFLCLTERECSRKMKGGDRLTAKNNSFWLILIIYLSIASIRKFLKKTTSTEIRSVHTNSESFNKRS